MNAPLSHHHVRSAEYQEVNVHHLLAQLDQYKRQSEYLSRMNDLHARLAGAMDVTSVIESFSVWLMATLSHCLLAYKDVTNNRLFIACSSHGPDRRNDTRAAEQLLDRAAIQTTDGLLHTEGYCGRFWELNFGSAQGRLLFLTKALSAKIDGLHLVSEAMPIVREPLQRALHYENLYEQARRDSLTGLANRWVFREHVPPILESARRHQTPVTLLSMDLDNFKQINDSLGHAAGDMVLKNVARILVAMVRGSDLLVRMGGDEFLVVLPNTNRAAADVLAGRLQVAVRQMALNTQGCDRLGISVGVAEWEPDITLEAWLQRADDALYQAKAISKVKIRPLSSRLSKNHQLST